MQNSSLVRWKGRSRHQKVVSSGLIPSFLTIPRIRKGALGFRVLRRIMLLYSQTWSRTRPGFSNWRLSRVVHAQLEPKSTRVDMLLKLRPAWDIVSGPVWGDAVDRGLAGILCLDKAAEIGQLRGMLGWGGSPSIVWWVDRERGLTGFLATQQTPLGNTTVKKLMNAWKKDLWAGFTAQRKKMQHAHLETGLGSDWPFVPSNVK
ncbi:hypothetical protein BDW68DRAFT_108995 [Aspergillus falconensis]